MKNVAMTCPPRCRFTQPSNKPHISFGFYLTDTHWLLEESNLTHMMELHTLFSENNVPEPAGLTLVNHSENQPNITHSHKSPYMKHSNFGSALVSLISKIVVKEKKGSKSYISTVYLQSSSLCAL